MTHSSVVMSNRSLLRSTRIDAYSDPKKIASAVFFLYIQKSRQMAASLGSDVVHRKRGIKDDLEIRFSESVERTERQIDAGK